ncbi:MAG: hypothetical protein ACRDD1_05150 [Planctomycetia bacterium]
MEARKCRLLLARYLWWTIVGLTTATISLDTFGGVHAMSSQGIVALKDRKAAIHLAVVGAAHANGISIEPVAPLADPAGRDALSVATIAPGVDPAVVAYFVSRSSNPLVLATTDACSVVDIVADVRRAIDKPFPVLLTLDKPRSTKAAMRFVHAIREAGVVDQAFSMPGEILCYDGRGFSSVLHGWTSSVAASRIIAAMYQGGTVCEAVRALPSTIRRDDVGNAKRLQLDDQELVRRRVARGLLAALALLAAGFLERVGQLPIDRL